MQTTDIQQKQLSDKQMAAVPFVGTNTSIIISLHFFYVPDWNRDSRWGERCHDWNKATDDKWAEARSWLDA